MDIRQTGGAHTVAVTVPFGTDVTALAPAIIVSPLATVSPLSGIPNNFTTPQTYTVTAEDSSTQDYLVTVTVDTDPDSAKVAADKAALIAGDIKGFNPDLNNITLPLANPLPSTGLIFSSNITWASSSPSVVSDNGQTINRPFFSSGNATVTFTATLVLGAAIQTKNFTLTVLKADISSDKAILTYTILGNGTVDEGAHTVAVSVPSGTNVTNLVPTITVSPAATVSPNSGIAKNFTTPQTYTVTAENSSTQAYTVTVTVEPDPLAAVKAAAHAVLATAYASYVESNYSPASWIILTGFKTNGDSAIDAATDMAGLSTAQATATAGMMGVETIAVTFARTDHPTGNMPYTVITGYFNADGITDLAVAYSDGSNVSILLGNGDGTFGPKTDYAVGDIPWAICTGDFNGDGKTDLAVENLTDSTLSILLGNGDGTFGPRTNYAVDDPAHSVTSGDFNGDGKADLAMTTGSNRVSIMLGNGDGTFNPKVDYTTGNGSYTVTTGDFNKDGKTDLATAGDAAVSILLGNGDGTFGPNTDYPLGTNPYSLTTGDFNNDGNTDLATANHFANTVSILLGNGDGTFAAAAGYSVGSGPASVTAGDFNKDGKTDLATANFDAGNTVSILLGKGDGTFGLKTDYTVGAGPGSVTAGDFNGDGYDDLASTNNDDDNLSILINTTGADLLAADKAALVDSMIKGANPNLANITLHLTDPLPSIGSVNASAITWTSDKPGVVSNNGQTINRPTYTSGDTAVNFTATLVKGAARTTKVFSLTVIKLPAVSDKLMTDFKILGNGTVTEGTHTVAVSVPLGTDVTNLIPTITISPLATVNPASGTANNFTTPQTYTVTAEDSSTQNYTVTVTVDVDPDIAAVAADMAALTDDSIKGGNPDLAHITMALTNPLPSIGANGSTITWVSDTSAVVSNDGQTINRPAYASGDANVTFTATVSKGVVTDNKPFGLTVLSLPASSDKAILSFTILGDGAVDEGAKTVAVTVPFGTDVTTLVVLLHFKT